MEYKMKQVLIMREDLNMSPGKLAAQAAHASICAYEVAPQKSIDAWKRNGMTKIVLAAADEKELIELYKLAVGKYLPSSLIVDEGRTEVTPGTVTAVGIGPASAEVINEIVGQLKLY